MLVLLPFLGLSLGARLGAATSMLVTIVPGSDVLQTAFARGANVPFGCMIAIAIGALLGPVRAERQLEERLRADVGSSGELIASSLRGIAGHRPPDPSSLDRTGRVEPAALLRDALRERLPSRSGQPSQLAQHVGTVDELAATATELWTIASETAGDRAPALLARELSALADSLLALARTYAAGDLAGFAAGFPATDEACRLLRTSFDGHRAARRTVDYDTEELARLLSVTRQARAAVRLLSDLAVDGTAPRAPQPSAGSR